MMIKRRNRKSIKRKLKVAIDVKSKKIYDLNSVKKGKPTLIGKYKKHTMI